MFSSAGHFAARYSSVFCGRTLVWEGACLRAFVCSTCPYVCMHWLCDSEQGGGICMAHGALETVCTMHARMAFMSRAFVASLCTHVFSNLYARCGHNAVAQLSHPPFIDFLLFICLLHLFACL